MRGWATARRASRARLVMYPILAVRPEGYVVGDISSVGSLVSVDASKTVLPSDRGDLKFSGASTDKIVRCERYANLSINEAIRQQAWFANRPPRKRKLRRARDPSHGT